MALTAAQLNSIYENVLFRPAEPAAIAFYANRTDVSDAQIRQQIELSQEAVVFTNPVIRLFETAFNRLPSQADLRFYGLELKSGLTTEQVATQLTTSAEFAARVPGGVVTADFVQTVYQDLLNRSASASEVSYYTARTAAQLVNGVANSPEATQAQAANVITFLDSAAQGQPNTGDLDVQGGPVSPTNGVTTSLTTGADNVPGTAGNDTINGLVDVTTGSTGTTLSAADTINGGAGTDILNITTAGGAVADVTNGALISGVEAVQIRNTGTAGQVSELAATATPGATFFNSNLSTGVVTVTAAAAGSTFGLIGNGSVVTGALNAGYANAATGAVLTVAGGTVSAATTDVAITGNGLTSLTINSIGGANKLDGVTVGGAVTNVTVQAATNLTLQSGGDATVGLAGVAANTTVTVNGAATSVGLGTLDANVKTVNAAGLTAGGVTATLTTATNSFTGGQGSDTITTAALTTTTAGAINAGAGTDTLVVTGTNIDTAAKGAVYTGFETLRVAGNQDVSLVSGITAVQVNAATSAVISGLTAAQAGAITVRGDQGTALTLTLANAAGTTDAVNLTLNNPAATAGAPADVDITGLSIIGVESLSVNSLGGGTSIAVADAATTNSLTFGVGGATTLNAITLTGTSSLDLDLTNTVNAITVTDNLSGSAALKVAGATVGGSVINGTANADQFTLGTVTGAGNVTFVGGAGNDTFTGTAAQVGTGHVLTGGDGIDTVAVSNTTVASTLIDNNFQQITGVEKFAFANTTGAVNITSGGFFDTNFKATGVEITATSLTTGGATIDLGTFTGKATVSTTGTTGAQSITTGAGDDVVTETGAATTLTASTGAGNDTITLNGTAATTGATATGGLGKDIITFSADIANSATASQILVNIGNGDSTKTAFDSVTGFDLGTAGLFASTLDFTGTATVAGNFAGSSVTGFTAADLTASSTNGIVTFQGNSAAGLTLAQRIEAVDSLINTDNATAGFVFNGNTYVFHDSSAGTVDSVVELVGVQATSLIATNATTAGAVFIA